MGTQSAILEGLRERRQATDKIVGNTQELQGRTISEQHQKGIVKKQTGKSKVIATSNLYPKQLQERKTIPATRQFENSNNEGNSEIIILGDGSKYIGTAKEDLPDAYGTIAFSSGEMYQGDWLNGELHGEGIYIYNDSSVFIGTWEHNMKHGKGFFIENGDVYDDTWEHGKLMMCELKGSVSTGDILEKQK